MASEPGGRADKLGNEFERLWTVRHLIELLAGRAVSVRIEALGDDERGTEFWVGRPDGTREAHQCKRENGSQGKWSIADLEAKRILTNAQFQLDRDPAHRFVFTSGDRVTYLSDLAERSDRCDGPAEFSTYSVPTSRENLREFGNLCRYLGLDPERPEDLEKVFDFLRRFRPRVVDKNGLRGDVEELAARWISGDPAEAVAVLKDLADKSIGRTFREPDVIVALPGGLRPRDLSKDPTLHAALGELQARFDRSFRHLLIGGGTLGRPEARDLRAMLAADAGTRPVLLHGPGGEGKSGVIFEVIEGLKDDGVLYLPLRLDLDRPADTPHQFGRMLDLPASPAACLEAAADGRPGVLILDQVDAIRWTAAHSAHAWDTCERIIDGARGYNNLRVVVVCRTFDVEDDPRLRAWKARTDATEMKVGPLDDATVDAVVSACGGLPSALDSRQRRVLRSPQGLYLWQILHEVAERPRAFRTTTDLMRAFWEMTRRKLKELRTGDYEEVLGALVEHMDRRGTLAAPYTVLAHRPDEVAALVSMNVLVKDRGKRLLFAHQTYLDHLTAEQVLRTVLDGTGSVLGWLVADDQSLFRRGQLRQLLALLRDDDPEQYVESLGAILAGDGVRLHLKHLALQMLGHADPPLDSEVDLVLGMLDDPAWFNHVFGQVLAGREAWFDALYERGVLRTWLDDERRVNLALNLIEWVVASRGKAAESLLLGVREGKRQRLEAVLWRVEPGRLPDKLFDSYVQLVRRGSPVVRSIDWKKLSVADARRCIRLLEARLGHVLDESKALLVGGTEDRSEQDDRLVRDGGEAVARAAATLPTEAWGRLMPCLLRVIRLSMAARRRSHRGEFNSALYDLRRRLGRIGRLIRIVLTAAGRALAETSPDAFWDRVAALEGLKAKSVIRMLARCIVSGPDGWAEDVIRWLLAEPARLRCGAGERGAVYRPARRLLRRYSGLCSDRLFAEVQAAILAHHPEAEKGAFRMRHDILLGQSPIFPKMGYDILKYNDLGLGQYLLLSALPPRRLMPAVRDWAGVLRRKFGPTRPLLKRSSRSFGGWVGSTIPSDRLHLVSDRNWLEIIRGKWPRRPHSWKQMGPDSLGEVTVETFARDLFHMARLQPRRFARLALRLPRTVDPRYVFGILEAIAGLKPPDRTPDAGCWEPATVAEIEAIVGRFEALADNREFAMALCRAVRERTDGGWSDGTLEWLARLAIGHPDPAAGWSIIVGRTDHVMTAINCVRGAAAGAIEAVLFDRPDKLGLLRPAIESLLDDPHPAVRVAATGLALPLLNIDRGEAVGAFLRACSHGDDEVLLAHDVDRFLGYTILGHLDRLRPVIDRMLASAVDEVAKDGAAWAARAWAYGGSMKEAVDACIAGDAPRRQGVAEALALATARGRGDGAVVARIGALFDDPEQEVRDAAAGVFRNGELFGHEAGVALAEAFVGSRALDDNVDDLLYGLEQSTRSLRPYATSLFRVADRLVGPLAAEARDYRSSRPIDAGQLAKVLLRLYEQAEGDRSLRRRCLDAWDCLLRERVGFDVLRHIDS